MTDAAEKAGVPVVRGLDWQGNGPMVAQSIVGQYKVDRYSAGVFWSYLGITMNKFAPCDGWAPAVALAEAHYKARITAALNPDFLSALDTARAEIERLGEWFGDKSVELSQANRALTAAQERIAELEADRRKVHELSATLRDRNTFNAPTREAAQEMVLLSSPLPDPNAEPTNATLSPAVKEPK